MTIDLIGLSKPFPPDVVNWKPQTISQDKTRALAVAYIDARDVAERLDEVVGPDKWAVDHKQVNDQLLTGVGILTDTGWVWKWDLGMVEREGDEAMSAKGSLSDGLKRAAVLWGIGRYLYRLPKTWVNYDEQKRRLTETPSLPKWALPETVKPANGTASANGARPYTPMQLKARFAELVAEFTAKAPKPLEGKARDLVAAHLELCFAGDEQSKMKRHELQLFLTGKASFTEWSDAEVRAAKAWLSVSQDSGGAYVVHPLACAEARSAVDAAITASAPF